MKHLLNICNINGAEVEPVDVVIGGSPCQDLSVAGKRAGLDGERSGLFMEQIRIIKEMRYATNGINPRYMVWENVPGAFSSNKGEDFRVVLEETAKIADETTVIPRPDKGKWTNAGVVVGDGWSIAWRVFDAQFWGVPQRRRRIALVADFGGQSAPEILFESYGVQGDSAESGATGERFAGDVANCFRETGVGYWGEGVGALRAQPDGSTGGNVVVKVAEGVEGGVGEAIGLTNRGYYGGDTAETLRAQSHGAIPMVAGFCQGTYPAAQTIGYQEEVSPTIKGAPSGTAQVPAVCCMPINTQVITRHNALGNGTGFGLGKDGDPAYTIQAGHEHGVAVCYQINDKATRYQGGSATRNKDGSGNGLGIGKDGDPAPTLTSGDKHAVFSFDSLSSNSMKSSNPHSECRQVEIAKCIDTTNPDPSKNQGGMAVVHYARGNGDGSIAPTMTGDHNGHISGYTSIVAYQSVRRLTPLECERLQGFDDGWTDIPPQAEVTAEDLLFWRSVWDEWDNMNGKKHHSDKQIVKWLRSEPADSARYKALGNSIALPPWRFVLSRIHEQGARTMASLFDGIGGFPKIWQELGGQTLWCSEVEPFPIAVTRYHFKEAQNGK